MKDEDPAECRRAKITAKIRQREILGRKKRREGVGYHPRDCDHATMERRGLYSRLLNIHEVSQDLEDLDFIDSASSSSKRVIKACSSSARISWKMAS